MSPFILLGHQHVVLSRGQVTGLEISVCSAAFVHKHCQFQGGAVVKNPLAKAGDADSIPGSGRSPEGGNGNPLQYSCLGNLMDRGAWRAKVHGVRESRTRLSDWKHAHQHEEKAPHPFLRHSLVERLVNTRHCALGGCEGYKVFCPTR